MKIQPWLRTSKKERQEIVGFTAWVHSASRWVEHLYLKCVLVGRLEKVKHIIMADNEPDRQDIVGFTMQGLGTRPLFS